MNNNSRLTRTAVVYIHPPIMPNQKSSHNNPLQQQIISKLLEKDISRWNCKDVAAWLDLMKMSHLKLAFVQNQISGEELLELTDSELMNELKVSSEHERRTIRELKDNRTNWIKLLKNSSPLSITSDNHQIDLSPLQESHHHVSQQPYPLHPHLTINTSNNYHTVLGNNNRNSTTQPKTQLTPTLPSHDSSLELDQISDDGLEDLTSIGGIFMKNVSSAEKLDCVLDSIYKDCDSLKFKLYKNNDIHVVTLKKIGFSYNSLKLEIIERFQFFKPLIRYKDHEGYLIRISTDADLARVLFTHHTEGSDILQPIKLVIENDMTNNMSTPTATSPKGLFIPNTQPHLEATITNNLNAKILKLELENAEKNETIRELEQKLSAQMQESEKQLTLSKSLQEEISTLKLQLYSMKNGVIFNTGTLKQNEEITEYIKLCKTLQHALGNAQNKLFEMIGTNGAFTE
ncbi:hypothetical protein C9374_005275 [Naegleria lovaniensis]|uniref:SAM domain-containing protein n=1 Tax=Naegleria lovaniensis TaxID=51637 RepID=A0AA88GRD3_NAELO|nr:uncharacterized protein C9374_005275 [Naegleria lovaniensis]KAG2382695.1 hypothetical protein C9374_005275 [Naegleria lovaniensis]